MDQQQSQQPEAGKSPEAGKQPETGNQQQPQSPTNLPATTEAKRPAVPILASDRGLTLTTMDDMWKFAGCVVRSGFAPKGMDSQEAVLIAMQLGAEIGLSPMAALQNVAVINGRPGVFGDAALAVIRSSGLLESYSQRLEGEGDNRKAVVVSQRRGSEPLTTEFSVADAKRANLWGKQGPWTQYPDRMLTFRARGFNLRDNFGDVLKGFRTDDELADMAPEPNPVRELPIGRVHVGRANGQAALTNGTTTDEPSRPNGEVIDQPPQAPKPEPVTETSEPAKARKPRPTVTA